MSKNKNNNIFHVVGGSDTDGITVIPDDSVRKRTNEGKRKAARQIKKISEKRNNDGARLSPFAYGIIIVLILIFVYIITDISSGGFLYTVNGKFVSMLSGVSTDDFSVNTDADSVFEFKAFGNGYLILTENGISYVDKSGDVSSSQQITYSSPSVEINDYRVMIYDRSNTSYLLMRNETLYSQQKTDNKIIDAAVSANDNYAIAVKDSNANSILYGMDGRGKIIYQWNCPHGYISDITITESGGKVAATVINSVNAVLTSTVYILDFEYDSAYAQFEYPGETVLGVKFLSGKKLQVVTDKNVYKISGKEQEIVFEYDTADICYADFSNAFTAVIINDYSNDDSYFLSVFGKNGKLRFSVPIQGKLRGLSTSDKSIAVLFTDKIETYSKRGKLVGCVDGINHYDDIVLNGNFLYVLSSDSVKQFPAYGNVTKVDVEDETA